MNRVIVLAFLTLTVLLSPSLLCLSFSGEERFFLDRVVAVVNRDVITWSELYKFMEFTARDELQGMNVDEKFKYLKEREEEYLERLIDVKLMIEEAGKFGISVSEGDVDSAIDEIKKKYGLSDREFEENLKREGLTLGEYRRLLKEQITIGRAVNTILRPRIVISEQEIDNYVLANPKLVCDDEGFYISQIFIQARENQEELKRKVSLVMEKLARGERFSKVASELGEDRAAKFGGEIGLLKKGEISKELLSLFSKMTVGQVSEPMVTVEGVYIFRLDGVCFRANSEALKNYVRNQLEEQKLKREHRLWTMSLRQRSYIEFKD